MPNASQVILNDVDLSFSVVPPQGGICAVSAISQRGPYGANLVTSWSNFTKIYGSEYLSNKTITLLKRVFSYGGQIIFNKLGHYTTLSDPSTLSAVKASMRFAPKTWYIRLNGPLLAGDTISINVGAVVSSTFATDSDTTLAAFVALLEANSNVALATAVNIVGTTGSDDRTIILVMATATVPSALTFTGTGAPTGTLDIANFFLGKVNEKLFSFAPKFPGLDYNNLVYDILTASNGNANYFNLIIRHLNDSSITETYRNLTIIGNPNIATSNYLQDVFNQSQLVVPTYYDLSATSGALRPINNTYIMEGGTDGGAIVEVDALGDSSGKTGLFAFDAFEDMTFIATPDFQTPSMFAAGASYTSNRKDSIYACNLSNSTNITAAQFTAARDSANVDTKYACFIGGGLKILNPLTGLIEDFDEIGDFLGLHAYNDINNKPWFSVANSTRGKVSNALGVTRDFGPAGSFNDLNLVSNHQIMMVGTSDKNIVILGNFSAQLANSKYSYLSIVKLLIYIKKALRPVLKRYLEEPNAPKTWKRLYLEVKPFLDGLKSEENLALSDYDWQGDQFANPDLSNLISNNTTDVDNGKYRVKLFLKSINPITELIVDITMVATGVSFED